MEESIEPQFVNSMLCCQSQMTTEQTYLSAFLTLNMALRDLSLESACERERGNVYHCTVLPPTEGHGIQHVTGRLPCPGSPSPEPLPSIPSPEGTPEKVRTCEPRRLYFTQLCLHIVCDPQSYSEICMRLFCQVCTCAT